MFKKFGVPVVQVGKSFELSEEEKKKVVSAKVKKAMAELKSAGLE